MRAVADAAGPAIMKGLMNGRRAEGLAGMDSDADIVVQGLLESLDVVLGRVVFFGPGQIETDHAASLPAHGQFGQFQR